MANTFGVVSPHLDDVALSCSRLLAEHPGSHVVTIFASGPERVNQLSAWDRGAEIFKPGDNVMELRRREDEAASELLRFAFHHLPYWDSQYRTPAYGYNGPARVDLIENVATDLAELIRELHVDAWIMPFGLCHTDHIDAAEACVASFTKSTQAPWFAYQELPYLVEFPNEVQAAVERMHTAGYEMLPEDLRLSDDLASKRKAVECYRSQMKPLGGRVDTAVNGPETFFRIVPLKLSGLLTPPEATSRRSL